MNHAIKCDECNELMSPKQINIKDVTVSSGIQRRVWHCVHCNKENIVMYLNKKIKRLMKENKEDRQRIASINRKSQTLNAQDKFASKQAQKALSDMEVIEERINKRNEEIQERERKLMDDYVMSMQVK